MEQIRHNTDYERYYPAERQFEFAEDFDKVRAEHGQTLAQAAAATGKQHALAWLSRQLQTLAQFDYGDLLKLTQRCYSIMKNRTLPQIMVFVYKTSCGDFGKIFGKPSSSELGSWWRLYDNVLSQSSTAAVQEEKKGTTGTPLRGGHAEYLQLKELAAAGDRAAQDGMFPPDNVLQDSGKPILIAHENRAIEYGRTDWFNKIHNLRIAKFGA